MTVPPDPAPERSGWKRVVALLIVGIVGGLLSGMFGVGGGVIMVPLLIWFLGLDQRHAAATSLAAIVPGALTGSVSYLVNGQLDLLAGALIAVGGIGGSLIGTRLLKVLPLVWLRWGFILLLLGIAVRMFLAVPVRGEGIEYGWLVGAGLVVLGVAMGVAAGLFGIGGGVIAVPVLIALFGTSDLIAKGTSLLAMIPTALTGTVANARNQLVRLSDGVTIGVAAAVAAVGGSAIAFILPPRLSSILFGCFIVLIAGQLTWRAIRLQRPSRREPPQD